MIDSLLVSLEKVFADLIKKIIIFLILYVWILPGYSAERSFLSLTGREFSYPSLIAGPKTVFFIWAVWCPYCRKELERVAQKCPFFEDIEIFFINVDEKKSIVDKFVESKGFPDCIRQKIILDPEAVLVNEFGIIGIPAYIFFENGQLLQRSYFLDEELLKDVFSFNSTAPVEEH